MYPKALIISHNVLGLNGNMGKTMHAYFEQWPKDKLCQLYFHSEVPTTHLCEQYFRVTDVDMVKGLMRFRKAGTVLTAQDIQEDRITTRVDTGRIAQIYQRGSARKPWMYLARNALWKLGLWKSRQLDQWIRECRPEVIFYASGDYTFSYDIALYISETYGIPLVVSIMDDYYFQRPQEKSMIARWNTRQFRKTMEKTMKKARGVFYVHPVMAQMYGKRFSLPEDILYKNTSVTNQPEPDNKPLKITYFGGLGLQRDQALVEIGQVIRKLIPDGSVLLDVYSAESRPEVLARMTKENGIRFHGQVSAADVDRLQKESNILVFAESFAPELTERLRCSLSTKIPEYLGSNRCVLAYGPAEAGSISYLLENQTACVATNQVQLEEKLRKALFSADVRRTYAERQLAVAIKNHGKARNHKVLYDRLCAALDKEGGEQI